jgi:hypothetical protein
MLRTYLVVDKDTTGLRVKFFFSVETFKVREELNGNIQCTCLHGLTDVPWLRRLVAGHLSLEDRVRFEVSPWENERAYFQKHITRIEV